MKFQLYIGKMSSLSQVIEDNKLELVWNLDYLYTREYISGISTFITNDTYFVVLSSQFKRIFDGGAGDGFCTIAFHQIQAGETTEDFIKQCVDAKTLLTCQLYVAVYIGDRPCGWDKPPFTNFQSLQNYRDKTQRLSEYVCLSLEELKSLAKMEIKRKKLAWMW